MRTILCITMCHHQKTSDTDKVTTVNCHKPLKNNHILFVTLHSIMNANASKACNDSHACCHCSVSYLLKAVTKQ
jgi:hypothetical protein